MSDTVAGNPRARHGVFNERYMVTRLNNGSFFFLLFSIGKSSTGMRERESISKHVPQSGSTSIIAGHLECMIQYLMSTFLFFLPGIVV